MHFLKHPFRHTCSLALLHAIITYTRARKHAHTHAHAHTPTVDPEPLPTTAVRAPVCVCVYVFVCFCVSVCVVDCLRRYAIVVDKILWHTRAHTQTHTLSLWHNHTHTRINPQVPAYSGLGTQEDSFGSVLYLVPKPPAKNVMKMLQNEKKRLRFRESCGARDLTHLYVTWRI